MRRRVCFSLIAVLCGLALAATSCRKVIDERQARTIADRVVAEYAKRRNLSPRHFEMKQVDDSGKVVDWFFEFGSTADPGRVVTVMVDRHGGFEVHHSPDEEPCDAR